MHGQANRPARKPGKGPELDQHMLVENATPQGHRGHVDDMETHPENEDQGQCAGEPGDASAEATAQLEGVDDGAQCSQQGRAGQKEGLGHVAVSLGVARRWLRGDERASYKAARWIKHSPCITVL